MNLIDVYIQEVVRRLPEKSRDDIALELRSTIEDMLPEQYSEVEVKGALERLGNPALLASGYRDRPMHLIGPRYFNLYISLLKMILPIAAVIALISIVAEFMIGYGGEEAILNVILDVIGFGIWKTTEVGMQVFFWLTIIFAILERVDKEKDQHPLTASLEKWTPDDLKEIPYIPKKKAISKVEVFGSLLWTAVWGSIYFYADQIVGVYEGGRDGLDFVIPALNHEVLLSYWPIIVIVIGLEIGLALFKLLKGQWTKMVAVSNTVLQMIVTIVFIVLLLNPNLLNQAFTTYMADLFAISSEQFKTWLVGGGIFFFIVGAVINAYDGFSKARVR